MISAVSRVGVGLTRRLTDTSGASLGPALPTRRRLCGRESLLGRLDLRLKRGKLRLELREL
jgi:hypothetical protein